MKLSMFDRTFDFDGKEDNSWLPIDVNYLRTHTTDDNISFGSIVSKTPEEITTEYLNTFQSLSIQSEEIDPTIEVVVENNL